MSVLEQEKVIDQWTHILDGRRGRPPLGWLFPRDRRRLLAYGVLDWYEAGASDKALVDLPRSYQRHWIDSGVVAYLGRKIAELTLAGWRAQIEDNEDASYALAQWLEEAEIEQQLEAVERMASIYGDGIARVAWDEARKIPVIEARHPGMFFKDVGDSGGVALVAHSVNDLENLDVEWYYIEGAACKMVTERVPLSVLTAAGNEEPLVERLKSEPLELACSDVPVVHVLNRPGADDRWGESDFARVLGLIDTWHKSACTDARIISERLAAPSRYVTGPRDPTIGVSADGMRRTLVEYEPGVHYYLGETGSVTQLDNSTALDLVMKYDGATWDKILKLVGLTRAGIGETGGDGNLREFQVKLMYGPTEQTIMRRRKQRMPRWRKMLKIARELWQGKDAEEYRARFGDARIEEALIECGPLMPEDVEGRMQMLATSRAQGGLPRRYYVGEVLKTLGIEGSVDEAVRLLEEEERQGIMGAVGAQDSE